MGTLLLYRHGCGSCVQVRGPNVIIEEKGRVSSREHKGDPLDAMRVLLTVTSRLPFPDCPVFPGAVGYLGYDMVRYFEKLPDAPPADLDLDESVFVISDSLVIFDNTRHTIKVVACAYMEDADSPQEAYAEACRKIDEMIRLISAPAASPEPLPKTNGVAFESNMTPDQYKAIVEKAKNYIAAGEAIRSCSPSVLPRHTGMTRLICTARSGMSTPRHTCFSSNWMI